MKNLEFAARPSAEANADHDRYGRGAPETDLKRWGVKRCERGQECKEEGHCGSGAKAGGAAASFMGERGSLRAAAQQSAR